MKADRTGRIAALSQSAEKGTAKENVEQARFLADHGMEGDAHAGPWHRQVSLLALESVEKMRARGAEVEPGAFGENITTQGVDLVRLKVGDRVILGGAVELEITQIGKECTTPCAIYHRVGDCVMPREGLFARVVQGGTARRGDRVEVRPCRSPAAPAGEDTPGGEA